jgi:hypothetical protein
MPGAYSGCDQSAIKYGPAAFKDFHQQAIQIPILLIFRHSDSPAAFG